MEIKADGFLPRDPLPGRHQSVILGASFTRKKDWKAFAIDLVTSCGRVFPSIARSGRNGVHSRGNAVEPEAGTLPCPSRIEHPKTGRLSTEKRENHSGGRMGWEGVFLGLLSLFLLGTGSALAGQLPGGCSGTGALSGVLSGCAPSAEHGKARAVLPRKPPQFSRGVVFRIRVKGGDWREEARRNVAAWVANRLYPHPGLMEKGLLEPAIRMLGRSGYPADVRNIGGGMARARVSAKTLNSLAAELVLAVGKGHLTYRLARVTVSGGTEKENLFIEKNVSTGSGGVIDAREISDVLYRASQVPGFARVDGIVAPAMTVRPVVFSGPEEFTIKSARKRWTKALRRTIVRYVGKRALDLSDPRARKIVAAVADRASRQFWHPLEIELDSGNTFKVRVPARLLNAIKNALAEEAARGGDGLSGVPEKEAGAHEPLGIVSSRNIDMAFVDETSAPLAGSLFAPEIQRPELENLFVNVQPAPAFSGSQIEVDNYGYAPTGAVVLNATGKVNNAGVAGGLFTVMAATSFGGLNSGTLSYSLPLNLANRVGADMNAMTYTLGLGFSPWGHGANAGQLAALGVSGSNYSGDLWASQTFVETAARKLALRELLFVKEFQDTYSQTSQNDRSILGGTLDLSGFDTRGSLTGSFDLSDTEYDLAQGAGSDPQNPFYSSTQGLQNYVTGTGELRYQFTPVYSATLGGILQQYFGGGVLDPMLQAMLGGVSNVMALPTASLFGNNLYAGTLALTRTDTARAGAFSSSLFFDVGQVTGVGTDYSAMGPGVEESFQAAHWFAQADLAVPVGALPTQVLGASIPAATGGNIAEGGIPLQIWLSIGARY